MIIDEKDLKKFSEQRIEGLNLKPNKNMPLNYKFQELNFKSAEEIAKRIMILTILIGFLYNQRRTKLKKMLKQNNLYDFLSNNEKHLLNKWFLTKQDRINVGWYSECIEVLGWTIGLWNEIEYLDVCNEDKLVDKTPNPNQNFQNFITNSKLIDKEKIYSEFDFIYRMHNIAKKEYIGKLNIQTESAYREKHRAILWVVGIENDWDNIITDT